MVPDWGLVPERPNTTLRRSEFSALLLVGLEKEEGLKMKLTISHDYVMKPP